MIQPNVQSNAERKRELEGAIVRLSARINFERKVIAKAERRIASINNTIKKYNKEIETL